MPTRRNFLKQTSLLSGALLYSGTSFLYVAADNGFAYLSPYLKLNLDGKSPTLTGLSVDSLGRGQFAESPLLSTDALGNTYNGKLTKKGIAYSLNTDQKPVWEVKCLENKIVLRSRCAGTTSKADPFVINISQQANHSTILGTLVADNQVKFPCLMHLPGMGTFRIHCSEPNVTLFYDAYRFHVAGEKGDPFVKAAFNPADAHNPDITYTLEVVSIYPDLKGIADNPALDDVRRNFINIFQLNPRTNTLANNSASDPCAFTLYLYAEMAKRTPKLADGFTAMDLIRNSLDIYLAGFKGYGQVGFFYNNKYGWLSRFDSSDSSPSLVISACYYILDNRDEVWAKNNYSGIKAWADKMIATDTNKDGIIEYGHTGNSNSWDMKPFQRPANWWDSVGFGHDDAYSNALAYRASSLLADVAKILGKAQDSEYYAAFAARLKNAYYKHFINPHSGVLAGWKSADGNLHDYYFTFVNAVAVCYGLLTEEQGKQVMQKMLQKMQDVGYTDFKLGLPGNLVPISPQDYAHHDKRWGYGVKPDGSDGFQIYENGGATGCYAYFTIKALYDLNMREEADAMFLPMMESFKEGGFEGHCEGSIYTKDWKTWDGKCWGYEGFLVDNYLPLLAVYDWHRK